jgi:hypothetical protein
MARMIVAKTGYDITAEQQFLSLDSDVNTLMIIDEQALSGSATEYTHGLGYLPMTLEFFNYGTQWFPVGSVVYNTSDAQAGVYSPWLEYDVNKVYITNNDDSLPIKLFISGNAADDQTGSGKNTASGKLKIAKDGLNAPDITDVRQFKFCSGLETIKKDLTLSGSVTISPVAGFSKTEVTHNLGYIPVVIAKIESNDYDYGYNGAMLPVGLSIFDVTPVSFYITTAKIVFFTDNADSTFNIKYNLYRNKLN